MTVPPDPAYDAVVLAGGAARRLGGADKPGALVARRALLDLVLAALPQTCRVVVVGPERPTVRPVAWVREDPPGGGPVPALAAGYARLAADGEPDRVALLAADLPFLDRAVLDLLASRTSATRGALLVDEDGREQWLCGVWPGAGLARGLAAVRGGRLAGVLAPLDPVRVTVPARAGLPAPWFDCDTADDLRTADVAARGCAPTA